MDLEQIEKLVEIIEKSTLKEITVEEGNLKINLKRENNIVWYIYIAIVTILPFM